mgnify:CR=1 FL=1
MQVGSVFDLRHQQPVELHIGFGQCQNITQPFHSAHAVDTQRYRRAVRLSLAAQPAQYLFACDLLSFVMHRVL